MTQQETVEVTDEDINRAAFQWCGEKDRETSNDDILYFKSNWKALPGLRSRVETLAAHRIAAEKRQIEREEQIEARPLDEYHEDYGFVTWWKFPVDEPSWIGSPTCSDWPGYHTHWTPHPPIPAIRTQEQDQ